MVQVQIRIKYSEDGDDASLVMQYEILSREDASEQELSIASSLEKSFEAINAKASQISGVNYKKAVIKPKTTKFRTTEDD